MDAIHKKVGSKCETVGGFKNMLQIYTADLQIVNL